MIIRNIILLTLIHNDVLHNKQVIVNQFMLKLYNVRQD